MEITTSPRRRETFITISQEPWALAIRQQYGDLPQLAARFKPDTQRYCALNMVQAVEHAPSFSDMLHTYGEEAIAGILATHITDAIVRMGEDRDIDMADIKFTATAICDIESLRILRLSTILGFFYWLKCGEFDIYGKLTPSKILMALRKYAKKALARQEDILYEKECREAREERERAKANAINLAEYARKRGRADGDFAALINEAGEKAAAKRRLLLQEQQAKSKRKSIFSDKKGAPK